MSRFAVFAAVASAATARGRGGHAAVAGNVDSLPFVRDGQIGVRDDSIVHGLRVARVGDRTYDALPVQAFFTVNLGWELVR